MTPQLASIFVKFQPMFIYGYQSYIYEKSFHTYCDQCIRFIAFASCYRNHFAYYKTKEGKGIGVEKNIV